MDQLQKDIDSSVKYCVTAIIDLQGFSTHLEVGNDLRTRIGNEALMRLEILDKVVNMLSEKLKGKSRKYFPTNLNFIRINDSLIFSIDLDDFFIPRIGSTIKSSVIDLQKAKEEIGLNINKIDMGVKFYSSPLYDKFDLKNGIQGQSLTVKTIVAKEDISKLWNDFLAKYQAQTDALLEEINTNLAGK